MMLSEEEVHRYLSTALVAFGAITTGILLFGTKVPYGKFVVRDDKAAAANKKADDPASDATDAAAAVSASAGAVASESKAGGMDPAQCAPCWRRVLSYRVNPRLGWVLMELPCSLWAIGCLLTGRTECVRSPANLVLIALFAAHYVNRAVVYPFRLSATTARMPIAIVLSVRTAPHPLHTATHRRSECADS
jgi:hypothetical protein